MIAQARADKFSWPPERIAAMLRGETDGSDPISYQRTIVSAYGNSA